ncbi:MAG: cytochrome b N-terminal domain-containing protein [Acidobacteriota bacterium]
MTRLTDWLEERTGLPSVLRKILEEPVPGGARWSYVLGSSIVFVLAVQALTGVLLALNYAPTSEGARASLAFIQEQVAAGRLLHGVHHWGAGAMVALVGFHLLQVFLWGAYRNPREATWIVGVFLFLTTLAFAFTGSLLPWDQNAYWAVQVGLSIVGTTPWIGHALQRVLQGSAEIGNLTLTRFYTLHVIILPIIVFTLLGLHVYLFLRRGVTPHWSLSEEEGKHRREPFYPYQLARDVGIMVLMLAVILWLAITFPPMLGAPADPSRAYEARPDWYFLFLFELLKYLEGPLELVGTLLLPAGSVLFLLAIPFLDRSPSRSPLKRLPVVVPMLVGVIGIAGLTGKSLLVGREERRAQRVEEVRRARVLEEGGALLREQPCLKCHRLGEEGRDRGPDLTHYGGAGRSSEELIAHLKDPKVLHPNTIMPSFAHLPDRDLELLVEFLRLQGVD